MKSKIRDVQVNQFHMSMAVYVLKVYFLIFIITFVLTHAQKKLMELMVFVPNALNIVKIVMLIHLN
jgi:hypothetical protein